MSVWDRVRAKVEEVLGRAEEVYGQSHGDAAAQLDGEAHRLEGEAAEEGAGGHRPYPDDDRPVSGR